MPTVQANGIDIYYEDVDGFNQRTLAFLQQHSG